MVVLTLWAKYIESKHLTEVQLQFPSNSLVKHKDSHQKLELLFTPNDKVQ